jgi:hypothetical protein
MPRAKRRREFTPFDVEKEFPELARLRARERAIAPPGFDQPASRHYEWIAATSLALADGFFSPDRTDIPAVIEECELLGKRAFALAKQVEVYLPEVYAQVRYVGALGIGLGMPHENRDAAVAEWRMIAQAASARLAADAASMEGLLLLLRAKTAAAPPTPPSKVVREGEEKTIPGNERSSRPTSPQTEGYELFYSFSTKDERVRSKLETHLAMLKRENLIREWHFRKILPGAAFKGEIDKHLNTANIILLLVSADFLASEYCYTIEMERAMERHEEGSAVVIPIILRPCEWDTAPFANLEALPKDGKPVTSWREKDKAFTDIAKGIRGKIDKLKSEV